MKLLGIDYGTKKVGLALSNDDGTMAFPHAVVANDEQFLNNLIALIEKESVKEIVIGHSKALSGEDNPVQEAINELVGDLTLQVGIPVHLEPEQYTSQAAARLQGRNQMTDASAAALILDSFITRQK